MQSLLKVVLLEAVGSSRLGRNLARQSHRVCHNNHDTHASFSIFFVVLMKRLSTPFDLPNLDSEQGRVHALGAKNSSV